MIVAEGSPSFGRWTNLRRVAEAARRRVHCPGDPYWPTPVRSLVGHIHEHLFEPSLTVQSACRACGIRDHNISSRFKYSLGSGIREYIEEMRIRAAKEMLCISEFEVYLIAFSVGYSYQESFGRAFRRRTGQSPAEWRRVALRGDRRNATFRSPLHPPCTGGRR